MARKHSADEFSATAAAFDGAGRADYFRER